MPREDKVCTRCVMDSTDPAITFDESGVCSFCKRYEEVRAHSGYRPGESERELERTVRVMKERGRDREYDCILGLSGGVDSAYMLYLANKLGLRVLAVHVDSGWNSEMAVSNIEKMCQKLDVRLHTYVMDWPTMKELQRAYLLSGVANLDVPQDHLFCAAIYQMARKYRVKYILNGSNIATEGGGRTLQPAAYLSRRLAPQEHLPQARPGQKPEKISCPVAVGSVDGPAGRHENQPA